MAVYPRRDEKKRVTSWQYHFYQDGKPVRRAGFRSRMEAIAAMEELKTDMRRGVVRPVQHPVGPSGFFDFAKEYLTWQKTRKRSWNRDRVALNHLLEFFGNRPLDAITAGDIEAYKVQRLGAGLTRSTIDRELAVFRHLFSTAVDWERVEKSPVKSKLFYREQNTTCWRILTPDEEERLFAVADERVLPFLKFALYTGLRKNQVLKLEWRHVDLIEERMSLPAEINKSKRPHVLPLGPVALAVLKSIRREGPEDYCFPYLSQTTVQRLFQQAVKRAKLSGRIRLHDLRHTFITRLSEAGNPIDRVRRLAQHSNLATTQRYMHTDEDGMREALQKLAPIVTSNHKSEAPEALVPVGILHDGNQLGHETDPLESQRYCDDQGWSDYESDSVTFGPGGGCGDGMDGESTIRFT